MPRVEQPDPRLLGWLLLPGSPLIISQEFAKNAGIPSSAFSLCVLRALL
jgi:hypothetical protein